MRINPIAPAFIGLLIAVACSGNNEQSQVAAAGDGSSSAAGNGHGSAGGGSTANGSGGALIFNVGGSAASANAANGTGSGAEGPLDPDSACTSTSADGQPVPVDLYFMVDITGSMNCPVPDDPKKPPCEVDPGGTYSNTTRWTVESAALRAFVNDPQNSGLGVGMRFFPTGSTSATVCDPATYVTPAVEIGELPAATAALDRAIANQVPGGQTPTVPSIDGAIQHARAWATKNPSHRVAVVYATDGYPKGCSGNTISEAATLAAAGYKAKIATYVLGVGPNLSDLNKIADAGGTTKAFLIDTSQNAAAQLAAALAAIRSTATLGCSYAIPTPPMGQTLETDKVNVTYTDSKGSVSKVLQDPPNTECSAGSGWQYSADKTQINLCGSLCDAVKADVGGKLQVLFGCGTEIAGPK